MTELVEEAVRAFADRVGRPPERVWSAPGRVNLLGEHTDYNEGFVLPFAIDRRTAVAVSPRTDRTLHITSTFDGVTAAVPIDLLSGAWKADAGWPPYTAGVAWALANAGADLSRASGADLVIASDVPVGAGLSSSAAVECAVALALDDLWALGRSRTALARAGQRAENVAVGAPTGVMDQMASLFGRRDAAVFLDCRTLATEVVPLGLDEAGLAIAVIDTGVRHAHATGGYRDRRASCERAAAALGVPALRDVAVDDLERARGIVDPVDFRRMRHIVTENQRVLDTVALLRSEGVGAIGGLLTASHASMRDDFEISVPQLDAAVDASLAAGALGARMTGGGFGGAAIALIPRTRLGELADAVHAAFRAQGFAAPTIEEVRPSNGAHRDR